MYQNALDPRAKRSKEWLLEALYQLIEIKKYENISIHALSIKSGVSRNTFYRHYNTIDDILKETIHTKVDFFFSSILDMPIDDTQVTAEQITKAIDYWTNCYPLIDALLKINRMYWFTDYIFEVSILYASDTASITETHQRYKKRLSHSMILTTLLEWIRTGRKETSEELAEILMDFWGKKTMSE